jgi:outer membrane protein OmpA-like peptidoglycan-associated protein/tetratricopeptide (TPR) repeat protein
MKKCVVLILILFALVPSGAKASCCNEDWDLLREEGDRFFKLEQFHLAIKYYRQLLDEGGSSDPAVTYRLAESYRKTFNYTEAEPYYFKVYYVAPEDFKLSVYYYGLMLKLNGKYDESIRYLDEFMLKNQYDNDLLTYVDQAMIDRAGSEAALSDINSKNDRYTLVLESINSSFNDYAPALADSGKMIITSGRTSSSIAAIDERYGEGFTDNYYFEKTGSKWHDRTRQSIRNLNTKFNDGSGCFSGGKYYFTVCGKESSQCKIVVSELRSGGRWTDPVPLNENVNNLKFESKHPAVSPGGDTLLFVTDRPGGFGGFDIWMSVDSGNENWGPAMNMGPVINTKMNEIAPAFANFNHVFFFASDGHQGFGGMDLCMGKRFSDGTQSVYNLGYPFNSNRDDCFISFTNRQLYISSNREGGTGGFDIYSSKITSPLSFISRLSLKNRAGRSDIKLVSLKTDGSWMDLFSSNKEDRIEYESLTYERKTIVDKMIAGKMRNKETDIKEFNGLGVDEYNELQWVAERQYRKLEIQRKYKESYLAKISPSKEPNVAVTGVLVDSLTGKPMGSVNIFLMNENGEVLKATVTNELGIFRFTNITGSENFYLRFERTETLAAKPGVTDLLVVADTPDTFTFDNIYFDTDHYDLRPEAKQVLDELGDFLKFIPDSQVEIFAYADDRGTDDYNFMLTKKRGEAVRAYLGTIGVDETAIAIVAKGRQTQHDDPDNEHKRQYNRRVEFYINGEKSTSLVTADSNK